jgi:hypothetical protein
MQDIWENTYSGIDRRACRDWTGVVLDEFRKILPEATISPTCAKKGHEWSEPVSFFPRSHFPKGWASTRGCTRCARRGLVVLETIGETP